ncbi:uncharacterized protein LOC107265660 [Cephus cinctus]|uniref:Uncharacterized protein LOC107265660 n=1 Tax=Cephus cinctus TaxID=211228 RepID=A0AAJ7VZ88_CEPCN|nr:uncharacterized protein LOC107265660 [Cephus cinctus]XP_024938705.1 uncharacterized protein LOC107265660 [Cephus cinctus]
MARFNVEFKMGYFLLILQCFVLLNQMIGNSLAAILDLIEPNAGDLEKTVFINFPRRFNGTRAIPGSTVQTYLPPESPTQFLPEVVDNRARNSASSSTTSLSSDNMIVDNVTRIDLSNFSVPDIVLRAPFHNGERASRFQTYSNFLKTKVGQRTTEGGYVQEESNQNSFVVRVNDMSCQNSGREIFFRASVSPVKNYDRPVIENARSDACKMTKHNGDYRINLENDRFLNCGVIDCSIESDKFYCLSLRFPVIQGLKLKDDFHVTLQCKTQEKVTSHTKQINVKTLDTAARMAPRIATGGFKNVFETDVALYRKTYSSDNIFDTRIQPGGTVILGEEVLLRVLVREGDGWKYSRISEVTVHYVEKRQRNKIMNSLWILDSHGCLNPDIREISSREQHRVSPLENYIIFHAFMFENMKETDEMILTVKVIGCLDGDDCALNCPASHVRRVRSTDNSNDTVNWQDDILFRVIMPNEKINKLDQKNLTIPYLLSICGLVSVIALLCAIKIWIRPRISKI